MGVSRDVGKLYPVAMALMTPVFRFAWRVRVEGLSNVPDTGGAILAPNHTSVLDSFFLPQPSGETIWGAKPSSSRTVATSSL